MPTLDPRRLDPSVSTAQRTAATVCLITGAAFVAILALLHLVRPDLDPTWRFVSEYALGRDGWLMTTAFVLLAVTLLAAVVATAQHCRTVPGRLGLGVLAVAAAGLLIAAAFETDPITAGTPAMTESGRLHVLGASLDYTPVGLLLISWSLTRTPRWRPARRSMVVAAAISTLLMIGFTASLPHDGQFGPGVVSGLIGRLLLVSYVGWTTVACRVVRTRPEPAQLPDEHAVVEAAHR